LVGVVAEEEGNVAVLKFGGGCQGCSSVSLTLKEGVEKTLMERIPGIGAVRDVTDHSNTENAYM
jgi:Fe/S biogenesis protein NfuA